MTAVLVLLPGPNVIGYYFLFRVIAHYLSWSGARQASARTAWQGRPEPALTELGTLARLPHDARAQRVAAIASQLHLPRLVEFFDRVARRGPLRITCYILDANALKLRDIADQLHCRLEGDGDVDIVRVAAIHKAGARRPHLCLECPLPARNWRRRARLR